MSLDIYNDCLSSKLFTIVFSKPYFSIENYFGAILDHFTGLDLLDENSISRYQDGLSFSVDFIHVHISPREVTTFTSPFVYPQVYEVCEKELGGYEPDNEWGSPFDDFPIEILTKEHDSSIQELRDLFLDGASNIFETLKHLLKDSFPPISFIGCIEDFLAPTNEKLEILSVFDRAASLFDNAEMLEKKVTNRYLFKPDEQHDFDRSLTVTVRCPYATANERQNYNFARFDYQHWQELSTHDVSALDFTRKLQIIKDELEGLIFESKALKTTTS